MISGALTPYGCAGRSRQAAFVAHPNHQHEDPMKFLLLIHGDATAEAAMSAGERRAIVEQHVAFSRHLAERGARVAAEALDAPKTARTIRFDGDRMLVTDGPFLEAKEALGGFYVLEAATMEEAIELTRLVPRSVGFVAELLPIVDM
jgi:hypothetical protein